ncbi:(d)CMP kinase [Dictyobacter arantiisoli]|uniref:Cytidylate kinase n=1 Tax=Dictyobacter arantiisoli TaxID=2014874 RepID=A0A5A5TB00_9CHLR|nr:(d)CMP kinase [Dictyobacter arantiisoli]GCF08336.1 cytidylate kinase [Dictyobacter arantiisoli]
MSGPQCIAIDGPAGSGKSTVGEQLARQLGYLYVDTGAMYRAVAWLALHEGVDIYDAPALEVLAQRAEIVISHPHISDGRQYTVTVNGRDVTWDIRDTQVTGAVSAVSSHPNVRKILIAQQREMAQQGRVVMVGRDIGAVVLPDAELKIYLTATLEERARRRHVELVERFGATSPQVPSLEDLQRGIERRDDIDHDNMRPAIDAIVIETDYLSVPQVLGAILPYVEDTV